MKKLILLYSVFCFFSAVAFERGIFILYLIENNYKSVAIGILQITFFFGNLLFEIPTGKFGDKYGKKISLILGLVLISIALLGQFYFIRWPFVQGIFFFLHGLAFSFLSGSSSALLYQKLAEFNHENKFFKWISISRFLAAMALSISIYMGGYLQKHSWSTVYFSSCICILLAIVPLYFITEANSNPTDKNSSSSSTLSIISQFWKIMLPISFIHMATTPFFIFSQKLFLSLNVSTTSIAGFIAASEISGALISVFATKYNNKTTLSLRFKVLAFLILLCLSLNLFEQVYLSFCVLVVSNSISVYLLCSADAYYLPRILDSSKMATVLSVAAFFDSVAIGLSYLLLGTLLDHFQTSVVLGGFILLFPAISLVMFFVFPVPIRHANA